MYGASGVHLGFQWDETTTTWTDLTTGMAVDTPNHVKGHKNHLFFSFGPSVQNSSLGDATAWTPLTGATEILTRGDVTGFMQMTGGVLGIWSRNSTNILSGSVLSDFIMTSMKEHGNDMGCIEGTLQQMGARTYFQDDRGIMDFYTSQKFGDFSDAAISQDVANTAENKKDNVVGSCVVKSKSQYRVFFDDGRGLIATFNGNKLVGWTPFYMPLVITSICNTEDSTGAEKIYFGSTDGYIYQLESTNRFDATNIDAYAYVAPAHLDTPYQGKRFKRAFFDIQTGGSVVIQAKPEFMLRANAEALSYSNMNISGLTGGVLGEMLLGIDVMGGSDIVDGHLDMPGNGEYIGMHIYSSANQGQWEVDGINYMYDFGRKKRG